MNIYKPILNTAQDLSVVKPEPRAVIKNPNPVYIGPPFSPATGILRIENFVQPEYQPDPSIVPTKTVYTDPQGYSRKAPIVPILMRNYWEVFNTNSSVQNGGYDEFSKYTVPSYDDLMGDYMNFAESTKPWAKMLADNDVPPRYDFTMDSHGYGTPWQQPIRTNRGWINQV